MNNKTYSTFVVQMLTSVEERKAILLALVGVVFSAFVCLFGYALQRSYGGQYSSESTGERPNHFAENEKCILRGTTCCPMLTRRHTLACDPILRSPTLCTDQIVDAGHDSRPTDVTALTKRGHSPLSALPYCNVSDSECRILVRNMRCTYKLATLSLGASRLEDGVALALRSRNDASRLRLRRCACVDASELFHVDLFAATALLRIGKARDAVSIMQSHLNLIQATPFVTSEQSDIKALMILQTMTMGMLAQKDLRSANSYCRKLLVVCDNVASSGPLSEGMTSWYIASLSAATAVATVVPELRPSVLLALDAANAKFFCENRQCSADCSACASSIVLARNRCNLLICIGDPMGAYFAVRGTAFVVADAIAAGDSRKMRVQHALLLLAFSRASRLSDQLQDGINAAYRALDIAVSLRADGERISLVEVRVINELRALLGNEIFERVGWNENDRVHDLRRLVDESGNLDYLEQLDSLRSLGTCAVAVDPSLAVEIYGAILRLIEDDAEAVKIAGLAPIRIDALMGLAEASVMNGQYEAAKRANEVGLFEIEEYLTQFGEGDARVVAAMVRSAFVMGILGDHSSATSTIQEIERFSGSWTDQLSRDGLLTLLDAMRECSPSDFSAMRKDLTGSANWVSRFKSGGLDSVRVPKDVARSDVGVFVAERRQLLCMVILNEMRSGDWRESFEAYSHFRACGIHSARSKVSREDRPGLGGSEEVLDNAHRRTRRDDGFCEDSVSVVDVLRLTVTTPDRYVAFVVAGEGEVGLVELGGADEVDRLVKTWREEILAGKEDTTTARDLRKLVWEPIEAKLPPDVTRIYLCPDGELSALPWAALPGREPHQVLLEQFAIAVVPYAGFLRDRRSPSTPEPVPTAQDPQLMRGAPLHDVLARIGGDGAALLDRDATNRSSQRSLQRSMPTSQGVPRETDGWLLVGNVDYGRDPDFQGKPAENSAFGPSPSLRWKPLPHAPAELETIANYLPPTRRTELTGRQATRSRVLEELPRARWAHLATHGFHATGNLRESLGLDNPSWNDRQRRQQEILLRRHPLLLSGIVLAGGNELRPLETPGRMPADAPVLTGEDVASLPLDQLELVVLSSCESGLGEVMVGEGIFGLQRAFHLAGAQNVVASLWQVDDQATAALMQWFYHFLLDQQQPPIEALRQAQLTVRRQGPATTNLAGLRGPNFRQPARKRVEPSAHPAPAPTRHWAGFFLSGAGE